MFPVFLSFSLSAELCASAFFSCWPSTRHNRKSGAFFWAFAFGAFFLVALTHHLECVEFFSHFVCILCFFRYMSYGGKPHTGCSLCSRPLCLRNDQFALGSFRYSALECFLVAESRYYGDGSLHGTNEALHTHRAQNITSRSPFDTFLFSLQN